MQPLFLFIEQRGQEMEQSHYFNQTSVDPKYHFRIHGFVDKVSLSLRSAKGLFSAEYFDLGTRILLKYFNFGQKIGSIRLLDLGCGYGLVSSFLASEYSKGLFSEISKLHIDACDSSPLAIDLTDRNIQEYTSKTLSFHTQNSDILSDSYFADKKYDVINTNPPFSAGKKVVKQFIQQGYDHLLSGGSLRVVIPTKKGAKSYIERCRQEFGVASITLQSLEAGYRVWTIDKLG